MIENSLIFMSESKTKILMPIAEKYFIHSALKLFVRKKIYKAADGMSKLS